MLAGMSAAVSIRPHAPADGRSLRVNIIGKSNGVGLARDLELLASALRSAGHVVGVTVIDARDAKRRRSAVTQFNAQLGLALRRWRGRRGVAARADVNLMIEHVWLQYLRDAPLNIAVPNPEWFDRHDQRFLQHVDLVWAKTGYTRQVFDALGARTDYIGFDSEDRYDARVAKERTYFHLAGKSTMKGTDRVLAVWRRRPEWPKLIVVQHRNQAPSRVDAANIEFKVGYLTDEELRQLQNQSAFHICTSRTEGWGHYIVEAMSVGAVTITVDAAPMNELVTPERGVLVPYAATGQQRLASTYYFDEAAFEAAIERTRAMTDADCARIGTHAREWFVANKHGFNERVSVALDAAEAQAPPMRAARRR
jgi:glycosyltransferase involved in cell wall biosynthesis